MAIRRGAIHTVTIHTATLTAVLAVLTLSGCGSTEAAPQAGGGPKIVVTTTWEGGLAKAAGARQVTVIVPQSVHHAPDYDPKPSDLAAVSHADFVLYAPFENFAGKIKEAAGSKAKLVEVNLDNAKRRLTAEVTRLAELFGTRNAAADWNRAFELEYGKLADQLKSAWPGGQRPTVVSQVFVTYAAELAGAEIVGTYGPDPVTASQLADLAAKKPQFVFDNAHMSTGTALPGSAAKQVSIINYPGDDLDMLGVLRTNASAVTHAMK